MNFKRLLLFLIAPLALVMNSCTDDAPEYTLPAIAVTDAEGKEVKEIQFTADGGNQTIAITATRGWEITSTGEEWLIFNPTKVNNAEMQPVVTEVIVTAAPNDGEARTAAVSIKMDKTTVNITVMQADAEGNNATVNGATPITVAEFLEKEEGDETIYQLTGTIGGSINTQYGNFDLTDETGTVYIYGLKDAEGKTIDWDAKGLKGGCVITVQGKFYLYNDKVEMKDALYISHEEGEAPAPKEGPYASDAAFVCEYDNSSEAAYGLGATKLGDYDATGFKLGKSAQEGKFTSAAVGVSGDKYLNFYAVSWGAGGDKTIYYRVNGGETKSQAIKANTGATGNSPYNSIVVAASDHYSVQLTGLKATDVIEFSTNEAFDCAQIAEGSYATRAIFFGVKLSDSPIEAVEGGNAGGGNEGGGSADAVKATVAEFLTAAEDATIYELTGTIGGSIKEYYGNFDLTDATGTVYIYGLVNSSNTYVWDTLGLKAGDTITVQGARTSYNGTAQMKNALYISHVAAEGGDDNTGNEDEEPETPTEVIEATIAEFVAAAESTTQWYQLTGVITSIEKADYGNIYIQDETGSVLIYGLCATNVEKNDKSFSSLGLKVGDTVTLNTLRTSYNGTAQGGGTPPAYYISHEEGEVVEPEVPEGSVLASAVFAEMGFTNQQSVDGQTITIDENVSIVFNQGGASNVPAYYDNGMAIRMYQNGSTLDVTAGGKTITSIELTFASNMYYIGADSGELSAEAAVRTWTGSASAVKFTSTGTDKSHRAYISAIKVTYAE